jgi:hypothetical protein
MRASSPLIAALALAGCSGATSIDVTVTFDEAAHKPQKLDVTITVDNVPRKMAPTTAPGGGTIHSGDDFVVLLPDALDTKQVTVDVTALESGLPTLSGSGRTTVTRGRNAPLTIPLGLSIADMGTEDLAAPPDLATTPDLAAYDAGCGDAGTTCAMGTETTCLANGMTTTRPCPFGCAGGACAGNACQTPGDVSAGGTFTGDSTDLTDDAAGSCGGMGGVDLVTQLTLKTWSSVTLDTAGTAYDTLLYVRKACATPGTELPLAGPCMGGNASALTTMCVDDPMMGVIQSRLVACGLPPGTYYPWLDAKAAGGGFTLDVKLSPVTLLDCPNAGNLLDGGTYNGTTGGNSAFSNVGCLDKGTTSPEHVYFFALTAPKNVTLTATSAIFKPSIYVRKDCTMQASELVNGCNTAPSLMNPAKLTFNALPAGLYTVVVDGSANGGGAYTLTYTAQ